MTQLFRLQIDLVDDDHAAQPALLGGLHQAADTRLDAGLGTEDEGRCFYRWQDADRATDKVRVSGRIDQLDTSSLVLAVAKGRFQAVLKLPLLRVEVADRRAAVDGPGSLYSPCSGEESFSHGCLARPGRSYQGNVPYGFDFLVCHDCGPFLFGSMPVFCVIGRINV